MIAGLSLTAMASTLPFSETFDGLTSGSVSNQNNWTLLSGSAQVQTNTAAAGSKALLIQSGSVSHSLSSSESLVWVRFQAKLTEKPTSNYTTPDSNASVAFFVNTNLNLVVYSNQTPVTLSGILPTNAWLQFDVYCDYTNKQWMLSVNGTAVAANLGLYSSNNPVAEVKLANSSSASVYVDELSVVDVEPSYTTSDTDGDGIPDWWEQRYFGGITNAAANALAANGMTRLQAYIAGLDPADANATFDLARLDTRKFSWVRQPGRQYDIYWTSNLLSGFNLIYPDVPESDFEDTNTVRMTEASGFYQIRVHK